MFLLISCKYSKVLNIYNHEYLYYNIFDENLKELYNKLIYAYAKGKIMIKSMTGFGRYEYADASRKITVEVKSVNHRYLDVNIKMPKKLNFFESALADIESLNEPFGPFRVRSSSSASGSAILLIFEFSIVLFSSATIFEMTIPSKAMMFLLISCKYSKVLNIYNHEYLYYNIFDENLKELYNKLIYAYAKGKIMIKSMTGFGRYEYADASRKITVEVKSVNHRYLDVNIKMPKKLNFFESAIRTLLKEYIERGKVDIYITYEDFTENNLSLQYNKALAGEYLKYLNQMAEEFGLENDIRVSTLSRYPEVFAMEEQPVDEDELWSSLEKALRGAFEPFVESRVREGENLKKDLCEKLDNMVSYVDFIEERSPQIIIEYRARLEEKLRELLADNQLDDSRIAQEVTIFADKICVDEETVRLKSHILSMKDSLNAGGSVGRKLDFLAQEMNREANTILSKSNDLKISDTGISLKTDIEKVREQIQNIE